MLVTRNNIRILAVLHFIFVDMSIVKLINSTLSLNYHFHDRNSINFLFPINFASFVIFIKIKSVLLVLCFGNDLSCIYAAISCY